MDISQIKKHIILLVIVSGISSWMVNRAMAQVSQQDTSQVNIVNPLDEVQEQYVIKDIKVEGAKNYSDNFIITTSGLSVGESIQIPGPKIGTAIKNLYQTGLFSDVKILQTKTEGNQIYLKIIAKEQPRLASFKFDGIKRSEKKDLKDKMSLMTGFAVTQSSKMQAKNTIKRFFAGKGYRGTTVNIKEIPTDTVHNRVELAFDIHKGKRLEIKKIQFEGNKNFSGHKLRKELKGVKQDAWWRFFSKALFKKDKFEEAKKHLIDFYHKNGYRDARIVNDSVYVYDFKPGKKGIGINIDLQVGPQYFIRNITWDGNTVYTDQQLTQSLDMHKGDVFNEEKMQNNISMNKQNSDITSLYQNIGYLFFQVQPEVDVVGRDSVDLHFHITEDKIAHIKQVEIHGNTRTHDDVIRRNLRTLPGAKYSRSNIMRSVRELAQLKYFVSKDIKPDLDYDYQNKTVNVIYNLKESTGTDNFEFSGGFGGRGIGLILSARLNFNNFSIQNIGNKDAWNPLPSGDGQKLSLGAQVTGGGYQSYNVGFQEPWVGGRPISLGFNVQYSLYKYTDYYSGVRRYDKLFSTSLYSTRRLNWPDDYFTQTTSLKYQNYNVRNSYYNENGKLSTLTLSETIERNSQDNPINPTSGSKLTLTGEIAPPIGKFSQYYKVTFKYLHHTPIVGKLVFTNGIEIGHMGWLGKSNRSPYERFYLGGTPLQQRQTFTRDNIDLKGYPGGFGGSISPYVNGNPVGGTMYTKYMTEMRYPVVSNDQVQLIPYMFAEGGNAYLGFRNFDPFKIKRAAGFGLRIYLPILGLVDLSYGYRFDGIPNTNVQPGQWEFLFNIGSPF